MYDIVDWYLEMQDIDEKYAKKLLNKDPFKLEQPEIDWLLEEGYLDDIAEKDELTHQETILLYVAGYSNVTGCDHRIDREPCPICFPEFND